MQRDHLSVPGALEQQIKKLIVYYTVKACLSKAAIQLLTYISQQNNPEVITVTMYTYTKP